MKLAVGAASFALAVLLGAVQASAETVRVTGEVTAGNYRALAGLLMDSFDKVVGLDVTLRENDEYGVGKLQAYEEDKLFLAYLPGEGSDSQISAREGYDLENGVYSFDGFYKVAYAGMGQGITAIFLEPAAKPAGEVDDVEIGSLKAPAN